MGGSPYRTKGDKQSYKKSKGFIMSNIPTKVINRITKRRRSIKRSRNDVSFIQEEFNNAIADERLYISINTILKDLSC